MWPGTVLTARLSWEFVLARVAIVPHPPLLVPQIAAGAAAETEPLRRACLSAARVLGAAATSWVAVGCARPANSPEPDGAVAGTFRGYGLDLPVSLCPQPSPVRVDVPLPFLIAGWLRDRVDSGHVTVQCAPILPGTAPADCALAGRELAARLGAEPDPVGLLVLGDGAATHSLRAPGYFDPRAESFDRAAAAALGGADLPALLDLGTELAAQLRVGGREAWQVGAAAAYAAAPRWRGELLFSEIPYGVAYHVAVWDPA